MSFSQSSVLSQESRTSMASMPAHVVIRNEANRDLVEGLFEELEKLRNTHKGAQFEQTKKYKVSNFKKAIQSLCNCETSIENGSDAQKLKYIGAHFANLIEDTLRKRDYSSGEEELASTVIKKIEKKKKKEYVPSKGSSGWFALMAINRSAGTRDEIRSTMADKKKGLTQALNKLIKENLITEIDIANKIVYELGDSSDDDDDLISSQTSVAGGKKIYKITSKGVDVIKNYFSTQTTLSEDTPSMSELKTPKVRISKRKRLQRREQEEEIDDDDDHDDFIDPLPISKIKTSPMREQNSKWELVLLLDNREKIRKQARSKMQMELLKNGINVELRSLPLGDMLWIVRNKRNNEENLLNKENFNPGTKKYKQQQNKMESNEWVFDYIVERKEISDLGGSIKDGRFVEQKQRLRTCGIENIIYLIEGVLTDQRQVSQQGIYTAMAETQIVEEFSVKHCSTYNESLKFLYQLHMSLSSKLDRLISTGNRMTYHDFKLQNSKQVTLTVQETFTLQLKQISQCSSARAEAITEIYPTPYHLCKAYKLFDDNSMISDTRLWEFRKNLLKDIKPIGASTAIGSKLSETIATIFTADKYKN